MIYLLSDLHGDKDFAELLNYINTATSNDLLILLGDICLNFENTEENREFTKFFLSIKKNIAFIDGNHENFEYLNSFPDEEWNGGTVRRLTKNIVQLKRGNVYTIENKTFFTFGGCKSSDKWKEMGLWYYGEEPSKSELDIAYENLKKHNHCIDYILTHKYEQTPGFGTICHDLQQLNYFIDNNVKFKKWYAGHWHRNMLVDEKHIIVYDETVTIE